MRNSRRGTRECQRDRCQVGVSTADDHDPCHDGICQFPCAQSRFRSLLPTSAEGFSFIGFLCSAGLYQLWCCLTVSDPDLAGFQSIIKECVSVGSMLLRMSLLQWRLMEKVTSPRGCAGSQQRQRKDQRRGTDKPQRQRRLNLWRQGCWLHCNQLCGFLFYRSVEKS